MCTHARTHTVEASYFCFTAQQWFSFCSRALIDCQLICFFLTWSCFMFVCACLFYTNSAAWRVAMFVVQKYASTYKHRERHTCIGVVWVVDGSSTCLPAACCPLGASAAWLTGEDTQGWEAQHSCPSPDAEEGQKSSVCVLLPHYPHLHFFEFWIKRVSLRSAWIKFVNRWNWQRKNWPSFLPCALFLFFLLFSLIVVLQRS